MCFMPKPKAPVISLPEPAAAAASAPAPAPAPAPRPAPQPTAQQQDALKPREAPKPPERRSSDASGSKSSATVNKAGRAGTILAPMNSGAANDTTAPATAKKTLLGA